MAFRQGPCFALPRRLHHQQHVRHVNLLNRWRRLYYWPTITIQPTPNLSASMPNFGKKNVFIIGWRTWPPSLSAANSRSASASVSTASVSEKPLNSDLPALLPSDAMIFWPPSLKDECMTPFGFDGGAQLGSLGPGASLKRISISTSAPSVFL